MRGLVGHDVHRVQILRVQHGLEVCIEALDAVLLSATLEGGPVNLAQGAHPAPRQLREGPSMESAEPAQADHAKLDLLHWYTSSAAPSASTSPASTTPVSASLPAADRSASGSFKPCPVRTTTARSPVLTTACAASFW